MPLSLREITEEAAIAWRLGETGSASDEVVSVRASRLVLKVQAEQIDFFLAALGEDFHGDSSVGLLRHIHLQLILALNDGVERNIDARIPLANPPAVERNGDADLCVIGQGKGVGFCGPWAAGFGGGGIG